MRDQAFEFIKMDIIGLRSDVKEVRNDVKDLLAFKWKLTGILIAVNFCFAFVASWAIRHVF